ncbi:hypothetical protein ACHAWF_014423 [Thalassiosira exigua]
MHDSAPKPHEECRRAQERAEAMVAKKVMITRAPSSIGQHLITPLVSGDLGDGENETGTAEAEVEAEVAAIPWNTASSLRLLLPPYL